MEQIGSQKKDFWEISYLNVFFFENLSTKFKFHYYMTRAKSALYENLCKFMTIYRLFLLRIRNVSDKFVHKIKTHILPFNKFFRKSCSLRDNVEKFCTDRGYKWKYNTRYAQFLMVNNGYRDKLRMRHIYFFSMAKFVTRRRLDINFIPTLPVLLDYLNNLPLRQLKRDNLSL